MERLNLRREIYKAHDSQCCRLKRAPSEYNPEAIMLHAGMETSAIAAFMHENMLHFFADEEGIEDASAALDYLGDAGALP